MASQLSVAGFHSTRLGSGLQATTRQVAQLRTVSPQRFLRSACCAVAPTPRIASVALHDSSRIRAKDQQIPREAAAVIGPGMIPVRETSTLSIADPASRRHHQRAAGVTSQRRHPASPPGINPRPCRDHRVGCLPGGHSRAASPRPDRVMSMIVQVVESYRSSNM